MSNLKPEIGKIGVGVQPDKDTKAIQPRKQLRWTAGQINNNREDVSQASGDGKRWGEKINFVDLISGEGNIEHMGVPSHYGFGAACLFGNDTVTSGPYAGLFKHTINSATNEGPFVSVFRESGSDTLGYKDIFTGAKYTGLTYSAEAGNGAVNNITSTFLATNSETYEDTFTATDSASGQDHKPSEWAHSRGQLKIGGINDDDPICSVNQLEIDIQTGEEGWQGCDSFFHEIISGEATFDVNGTLLITEQTREMFNKYHYGSANPASGTKPTRSTFVASFTWKTIFGDVDSNGDVIVNANLRSVTWTLPSVRYSLDPLPDFSPTGGAAEISFEGEAGATANAELVTIEVVTADEDPYLTVFED